ncbi:MAG: serine/threonine protein kinase [Polyangiaceae bacterium]
MPHPGVGGGTIPMAPGGPSGSAAPQGADGLRLLELLGRGAMGEVHRAEQVKLARLVAVKTLIEGSSPRHRERFEREAQLTAQLDHPNIVPVYTLEVGGDGSATGYVMKLVEGKTLRALLTEAADLHERGAPIDSAHSLSTLLEHFLKICDALAFAHDKSVLHRDLKPANIMIGRFGEVYVMDWGVARQIGAPDAEADEIGKITASSQPAAAGLKTGSTSELTRVGEVIGSLAYMSPEQARGRNRELDARADQYALGLILFEIVTLQRAVNGANEAEALLSASLGEKRAFEHVSKRVRVPRELRAIVDKATAFEPKDRYPTTSALADDVRRYLRGDAVVARPDGVLGSVLRWIGRHRRTTLLALVAVVVLSGLGVSFSLYRETARELSARQRADRISELAFETSAQAHRIDERFRSMETSLEGLRVAAEWALAGPLPDAANAPVYTSIDFADPKTRPADFTTDTQYRWPVSVEFPVAGIAPTTPREEVMPKLRKISPLRRHMRAMMLTSAGLPAGASAEEERAALLARKAVFDYTYVNLKEGVIVQYPGMAALPPDYDVRTASFYTISENKRGKHWGNPYVDSTTDEKGDDLVLPVTEAIWSREGEFLGVAGVELTVTKLVETNLALTGRSALRTSLVDSNGRKIVDSGDAGKRFKASGKDESIDLSDFDIPEVAQAIRKGAEGVYEVTHQGRRELVAFTRLSVLGWYYVAELDAASVLKKP